MWTGYFGKITITCENSYGCLLFLQSAPLKMFDMVLNMLWILKMAVLWICHGSEYIIALDIPGLWLWPGSEYTTVLNILLVLHIPRFWIYQSSNYFEVTQGSEYAWIIPPYAWLCLHISEYASTCCDICEYG